MDPQDLARARWVEARLNELPKYAIFFYNLLVDRHIPDPYKVQVFAAISYVLDGGDILPRDDAHLAGVDALGFAFRCMSELFGHVPPAMLARYEEVLHREGISARDRVREVPGHVGRFYVAVHSLYRDRIGKRERYYKNAIETGRLVEGLQRFLTTWKPIRFTPERAHHVEAFLDSFELKRT